MSYSPQSGASVRTRFRAAMAGTRAVFLLGRRYGFSSDPVPMPEVMAALGFDEKGNPVKGGRKQGAQTSK